MCGSSSDDAQESHRGLIMQRKANNRLSLSGKRFGSLLVVEYAGIVKFASGGKSSWKCQCDCGNHVVVLGSSLTSGNTSSCGCVAKQMNIIRCSTHGMSGTRVYRIWRAMHTRCSNKNSSGYDAWGGRGIKVCDRWQKFETFFADMGDCPAGMSIDRINNNGDYEPSNCRWATRSEQGRNTRATRFIEFNGQKKCLIDWADSIGIDQSSLRERLDKWPLSAALTTPKRGNLHGN